ncbi:hypothetical protein [Streptomyces zaehneri]|uniref:hypothetical protein n=1 Tax=Streptomyces zaehneri TaxID=3051180 RepID=UPI0028D063D1|nr:hypothetical protein [Streptomyces sp. DSM 40713]
MGVHIEFVDQSRGPAKFEDGQVSHPAAYAYCYELLPHGVIAVYKVIQPVNKKGQPIGDPSREEVVVYGPAAWLAAYGRRWAR